jgi:hypothetical protein
MTSGGGTCDVATVESGKSQPRKDDDSVRLHTIFLFLRSNQVAVKSCSSNL